MLRWGNESESSTESMNGSWVKLEPSKTGHSVQASPKLSDGEEMETLLADAVEDQMRQSKRPTSQASPRDSLAQDGKSDWVQAWASRPEQRPTKKQKMEHPTHAKVSGLSIRRTKVMKSAEFLGTNIMVIIPVLVLSHAITLGFGMYLGKKWVSKMAP